MSYPTMPKKVETLALFFIGSCYFSAFALAGQTSDWSATPVKVPEGKDVGFDRLPSPETGITFTNRLAGDAFLARLALHNGSGVAAGDVNDDGLCDLYFCALQGPNRLYLNQGDWHFLEAGGNGEIACSDQYSTGAVLADVDGDADLDLLVNGIGAGTRLFLNRGDGTFRRAEDSGLHHERSPTSMALADVDGDRGGRELLLHGDDSVLVETGDPGVCRDVDVPSDLDSQ
jgi:hypothetical protein